MKIKLLSNSSCSLTAQPSESQRRASSQRDLVSRPDRDEGERHRGSRASGAETAGVGRRPPSCSAGALGGAQGGRQRAHAPADATLDEGGGPHYTRVLVERGKHCTFDTEGPGACLSSPSAYGHARVQVLGSWATSENLGLPCPSRRLLLSSRVHAGRPHRFPKEGCVHQEI